MSALWRTLWHGATIAIMAFGLGMLMAWIIAAALALPGGLW